MLGIFFTQIYFKTVIFQIKKFWSGEAITRAPHRTLGEGDEGKGEDQILLALDSSPNYINSSFDIFVFRNIFCDAFL